MSDNVTHEIQSTSVTCPLCTSQEHQTIATRGRAGEDLHTVVCTGCGLVFTSPIPTPKEVAQYYGKEYRLSYKGVAQPKKKHIYRAGKRAIARLPLIREYAQPGDHILDVGSGGGEFTYLLKTLGYSACGIEPDEGYGGYSIQEYDIDVQIGPFADCTIEPDSLDLVTAYHVVEHLCDPLHVFRGIYDGLKTGGHFIVEVPNVESTYHTPSNKWHFAHIFNFNPVTMQNLGRRAGFEVVANDTPGVCEHVRVVFQKVDQARPPEMSHENYHRVRNAIDGYTDWDHFGSLMPAKRLWSSVSQVVHERVYVNSQWTGKQILDNLYAPLKAEQISRAA